MKWRLGVIVWPALVLVGLLWSLGCATRPARDSFEDHIAEAEIASQTTPTCTTHTTGMTLTAGSTTPEVGDRLWVTVTLANEGCGLVGLPRYRLLLEPSSYILVPDSPISVTHYLALEPGATDVATFSLQTIGVGDVALRASASFEVHLGYPGPAYWSYDTTTPVSVSVPMTDTEVVVLQQAAYEVGCFPDVVQAGGTAYEFGCPVAAGHAIDARIERFTDEEEARTTFTTGRGDSLLESFHCYPAYGWEYEQERMPQKQVWHSWLAERWIITAHSVDDTGIPVAPAPVVVSGAVYRSGIRNHLFAACDRIYLPVVRKAD